MKKLLDQKFNYTIKEKQSFSMFRKSKYTNLFQIDMDINLTDEVKNALNRLYIQIKETYIYIAQ